MPQFDFSNLGSPLSGSALVDDNLEPWRDALHSMHSGTSRPEYAVAGLMWLDNTTDPWVINLYTGTTDIAIGTVDISEGMFTANTTVSGNDLLDVSPFIKSLFNDADQATALATLGAATAAQGGNADNALQPVIGQILQEKVLTDASIVTVSAGGNVGPTAPNNTNGQAVYAFAIPTKLQASSKMYCRIILNLATAASAGAASAQINAFLDSATSPLFSMAAVSIQPYNDTFSQAIIEFEITALVDTNPGHILNIRIGRTGSANFYINRTFSTPIVYGARTTVVFTEVRQ